MATVNLKYRVNVDVVCEQRSCVHEDAEIVSVCVGDCACVCV